MPERCSVQITIRNRLGLHARPAMSFVDTAAGFNCSLRVRKPATGDEVNGGSIMEIMMLAATQGTVLEIIAEGPDAEACCNALRELVEVRRFDEP